MSSPPASVSALPVQTSEVDRYFRRNYLFHGIEGGLYIGGMAFVSPQTVLPRMVQELGGSNWLVAFTPVLMMLGFTAPGIFVVHRIQRLERLHRFILAFGLIQRLPYLVAGLLLVAGVTGRVGVIAVSVTPLLSGLAGGFSVVAWIEFVARCIPERRRASLWAVRFVLAGFIGLFAGKVVERVLSSYSTTKACGVLHLAAFAFMMGSYFIFASTREPRAERPQSAQPHAWSAFIRAVVPKILADASARRYVMTRILLNAVFLVLPFLGIHTLGKLHRPDAFLGTLLGAQMAGNLVGNMLGGPLGDRLGARRPMLLGLAGYALLCLWAPFASTEGEFITLFALLGLSLALQQVAVPSLDLAISPDYRIATQAVLGISNLLGIVVFSVVAGLVRSQTTDLSRLSFPAFVALSIAGWFLWRVRDPNTTGSSTGPSITLDGQGRR